MTWMITHKQNATATTYIPKICANSMSSSKISELRWPLADYVIPLTTSRSAPSPSPPRPTVRMTCSIARLLQRHARNSLTHPSLLLSLRDVAFAIEGTSRGHPRSHVDLLSRVSHLLIAPAPQSIKRAPPLYIRSLLFTPQRPIKSPRAHRSLNLLTALGFVFLSLSRLPARPRQRNGHSESHV
jgi:hypothetical protein